MIIVVDVNDVIVVTVVSLIFLVTLFYLCIVDTIVKRRHLINVAHVEKGNLTNW
jgi:hypothetical protein